MLYRSFVEHDHKSNGRKAQDRTEAFPKLFFFCGGLFFCGFIDGCVVPSEPQVEQDHHNSHAQHMHTRARKIKEEYTPNACTHKPAQAKKPVSGRHQMRIVAALDDGHQGIHRHIRKTRKDTDEEQTATQQGITRRQEG